MKLANLFPHRFNSQFSDFLTPMAILLSLSLPWNASAKREYRDAFFATYPSVVGTRLDTLPSRAEHCGVCHYRFQGGGSRNPYGSLLESALSSFPATAQGRMDAVWSIRNMDPDAGGAVSQLEITELIFYSNTPTFPGLTPANIGQVAGISTSDIALITDHLVPATGSDTTPPSVVLIAPAGGATLVANASTTVRWSASDESGVSGVSLYLSLDNGLSYKVVAAGLPNSGTHSWFPANRPTTQAKMRVVAVDNASNRATNQNSGVFSIVSPPGGTVPTTLRDFDMPGTQPMEGHASLSSPAACATCHGNYNPAVEPSFNWQGSMMAHASLDPLFEANMTLANQDAPDSGDLCLRCHIYAGWVGGRSVPTDGSAMLPSDLGGVLCDVCHRMVDPIFDPGVSPSVDQIILAALSNPGNQFGNGMLVLDPDATRRGPFVIEGSPHETLTSPFHREAAFCGTCHDVSNPAFEKNAEGRYVPNAFNAPATNFSAHHLAPVERTYSEWLHSEYNTPQGVLAPEFAGAKPDGRVATCQDCHMRDVSGAGANPSSPNVPIRPDLPLHDMTGGSTWLLGLLPDLYPGVVNAQAAQAGVTRGLYMLSNAADLAVVAEGAQLKVTVTNQTGHKLPTGYPEGRRVWLNVSFYDESMNLIDESASYDPDTGVLTLDPQAKIYEVEPGISPELAALLGLPAGPSFHFVLNDSVYKDNRIPPRGFLNAAFASFGGAPVAHSYADGQYWDDTYYALPSSASRAQVRLYYQSTSKEFIEHLRDENHTDNKGDQLYALWNENGKCPPVLMAEVEWRLAFQLLHVELTESGTFRVDFRCRPGTTYTIEFADTLGTGAVWREFARNGSLTPDGTTAFFVDDFTGNTSGVTPAQGRRFYRFRYTEP